MSIRGTTNALEAIALALARIIEILAPILMQMVFGAVKGFTMAASNTQAIKKQKEKLKELSNKDEI
jgi:hypothetical protein